MRGTRHNTGDGIRMALDIGAVPFGNWSGCHSVAWDISAPPFGDRWVLDNFQKHSYPLGIMVNLDGKRFVDEGEHYRNLTYVKFGRAIMGQPQRWAAQIFDQKTVHRLRDEYRIKQVTQVEADTIEGLAEKLEIDPAALEADGSRVQCRLQARQLQSGRARRRGRDGHLAAQIELGAADRQAALCGLRRHDRRHLHVRRPQDRRAAAACRTSPTAAIPGLYAAGELVGGLFYENYPGGTGLMSGSVFGKRAGTYAAEYARGINEPAAKLSRDGLALRGHTGKRSSSSIDTPSGPVRKAMRMPGRTDSGSRVKTAPLALRSAHTASMFLTDRPK